MSVSKPPAAQAAQVCCCDTFLSRNRVTRAHVFLVAGRRAEQLRSIDATSEVVTNDTFPGAGTAVLDHFVLQR